MVNLEEYEADFAAADAIADDFLKGRNRLAGRRIRSDKGEIALIKSYIEMRRILASLIEDMNVQQE